MPKGKKDKKETKEKKGKKGKKSKKNQALWEEDGGARRAATVSFADTLKLNRAKRKPKRIHHLTPLERKLGTSLDLGVRFDRVAGRWTDEYEAEGNGSLNLDWAVRGISRVGRVFQGSRQIWGPLKRTCDFEWTISPPSSPRRIKTQQSKDALRRMGSKHHLNLMHADGGNLPIAFPNPYQHLQKIVTDPLVTRKARSPRFTSPDKPHPNTPTVIPIRSSGFGSLAPLSLRSAALLAYHPGQTTTIAGTALLGASKGLADVFKAAVDKKLHVLADRSTGVVSLPQLRP